MTKARFDLAFFYDLNSLNKDRKKYFIFFPTPIHLLHLQCVRRINYPHSLTLASKQSSLFVKSFLSFLRTDAEAQHQKHESEFVPVNQKLLYSRD